MISGRLQRAHPALFAAIEQELRTHPPTRLRKLEIGKDGTMQVELVASGQPLWKRWNHANLQSLAPDSDPKVSLGRLLSVNGTARDHRVLSYRPGRRLTVLQRSSDKLRILKGFRKGRLPRIVERYEQADRALSDHGIRAPRILEVDKRNGVLVMDYEHGKKLRMSAESIDGFHLIGECLTEFQCDPQSATLDRWTADQELDLLDQFSNRHTLSGLGPHESWHELRKRLGEIRPDLPEARFGLCHRDLHDKQFLRCSRHIRLLDFDLLCRADLALDPANLLAHLRLRQLQERKDATPANTYMCGKRLLQGLTSREQPGFWERLRFYQATTFARLALLYALRPKWEELTPDLIVLGNRCLDDLQRVRMN